MKNLATQNQDIVTISETGEGYISQTKLAELCGVSQQAISKHIAGCSYKANTFNQLHFESMVLVVDNYAKQGKQEAIDSLGKIAKAGAQAYIYYLAGFSAAPHASKVPDVPLHHAVEAQLLFCKSLSLPESGTLKMLSYVNTQYGSVLALPAYAIDNGGTVTSGSSRPTLCARDLLKQHGSELSANKFNTLLVGMGVLETLTRLSSRQEEKHFKSVTAKGLKYGKNVTSPSNPKETQPHWYVDTFGELLELISLF